MIIKRAQMGVGIYIVFILPTIVFGATGPNPCTTPNGEKASCIPLSACKIIYDAVLTRNPAAVQFAKNAQCGFEEEPLVCCGTQAYPSRSQKLDKPLSSLLPDRTICGTSKPDDRVFGGEITEIGEFPWVALLGYKYLNGTSAGFKCGGTVINNRYILTAAHCVIINSQFGYELDMVRLGEWRISTDRDCEEGLANEECSDPVVDLKIEDEVINSNYNIINGKHDIALLRLERNFNFTDYIRPICLPQREAPEPPAGTELVIAGWGATENSTSSDYKLKVKIPLVDRAICSAKVRQRGAIIAEQLCAGGVTGKDSCQGDSGGPLMGSYAKSLSERNQWYQEGIVSWGVGCGVKGYPGIYTKVSKYMQWISDELKV